MASEAIRYLILPGWQGSSAEHWQSHWQRSLPNSARVEQQDWLNPLRADWVAALNQANLSANYAGLVRQRDRDARDAAGAAANRNR